MLATLRTRVGGSFQGVSERFYVSLCFSGRIRPGAKEGVTRIPESSYYPHQPWASVASKRRRSRPRYAWGRPPGGRSRLGPRWGQRRAQIVLAVAGVNPARGVSAGRARGRPHRRVDPTPRSQLRGWGQRRRARGRPHRRVDPTPRSQLYRLGSTRGRRSQPRVPALVKDAPRCAVVYYKAVLADTVNCALICQDHHTPSTLWSTSDKTASCCAARGSRSRAVGVRPVNRILASWFP